MLQSIIFPRKNPTIAVIKEAGRIAVAIPGDLRDEGFCKRLVSDAVKGLGGLDIIVCNAGRQQSRPSILDIMSDDFDATMKTNIYAPFWIIKAALPHLAPGSCIIGTTSEQAYDPSPDLYDYAQTKAATMNYVKSLAKQLGPKGIRVNGVAPGPIWTPLQISGGAPEEKYKRFGSTTLLGRPGQPAELASIYVPLAADDASFATGNINGSGGGRANLSASRSLRLSGARRWLACAFLINCEQQSYNGARLVVPFPGRCSGSSRHPLQINKKPQRVGPTVSVSADAGYSTTTVRSLIPCSRATTA
jgi:NAD(P)-dependent dehydrogenase (short-subunit alcohol dehydrogenase family)